MAPPVFRFAPSPNGFLHLGHAYSALENERLAEALGGTLLLRLENIDPLRCRPAYEDAIIEDLCWLGLRWSGPVWRQSDRMAAYADALARLTSANLLYPCFCSRGEIAAAVARTAGWLRDPDGAPLYPGTCRGLPAAVRAGRLAAGDPHALRLDMGAALRRIEAMTAGLSWTEACDNDLTHPVAADPARWGDVLLARKDVATSYHLAVVVDDAAQRVTHVVRGRDLFAATAVHRLLQILLGLPEPVYRHHPLLRDATGEKLAKSRHSDSLRALRNAGFSPQDLRRRCANAQE